MAEFLAVRAQILRAFVFPVVSTARGTNACAFGMVSFARIAISALARDVSGLAALGTRALGACVRVATVALRLTCGAEAWTILVSGNMRGRATMIANHALDR